MLDWSEQAAAALAGSEARRIEYAMESVPVQPGLYAVHGLVTLGHPQFGGAFVARFPAAWDSGLRTRASIEVLAEGAGYSPSGAERLACPRGVAAERSSPFGRSSDLASG